MKLKSVSDRKTFNCSYIVINENGIRKRVVPLKPYDDLQRDTKADLLYKSSDNQSLYVKHWVYGGSDEYTNYFRAFRQYPERESANAYDYRSCDWLYDQWMFNAQTGERYYSNSNSDSWCYAPSIIEW